MNVVLKKLDEITPYKNNPRKNDKAVKYVANSIKQFGFKVPIIIDKSNTIVTGHTRYKAAQMLHLNDVPCVVADDLSDEQISAFRLADNKVAEQSEWDYELLSNELDNIIDIDMSEFDFLSDIEITEKSAIDLEEIERVKDNTITTNCPKCGFCYEVKK